MEAGFRILGPIEVDVARWRDGPVPRGRTLSFLALLLVDRGRIVSVERAVDELWEGAGPQHARKAVHVVASRLRAALDAGVVQTAGSGYSLRLAPGELDAERFEDLHGRGRRELGADDPREAAATLRAALALWRGPALADVAGERFAQPEIARLEDLRDACLGDRLDADLACGRHGELVGELEALVQQHPLRERLRGQQMLALYRAERQADALDVYREAYDALTGGLGIEPSPRLRALQTAILRHEVPGPVTPPGDDRPRASLAVDARRLATCVFARVTGSDERAGVDAESLRAMLDGYHEAARAVLSHHGGTVAELRNDAVLAVFGTAVAHEDDPQRALRATAELTDRTERLPFGVRACCGVSTGEVVAAAEGAGATLVIGAAVGAAERLARAAAPGEIRMDEPTWRRVRHGVQASGLRGGAHLLRAIDVRAPAIARRPDRPLLGREPELDRLRATFARVVATRKPALLTILGDPGIGKTRLAAGLTAFAGDDGRVLTGHCLAYGEGITYWPLREIVLQTMDDGSVDDLAAGLGLLPSVAHQVVAAVGLAQGQAGDDGAWAIERFVEALARRRPLILVIDDAHLAEPALLDLLLDAVDRLVDAPALIACVARTDLLERRPDWASRVGADGVLVLGPLSAAASAQLIAGVAGDRLGEGERRRIALAAGGNPLFLEQLVAYVAEQPPAADVLPPALHALLAARLDRLEAVERAVLALGAVVGDSFATAALHALAGGIARSELEQACDRLAGRDLLVPGEAGVHRFRHGLLREAAYASLAKATRAQLHERHAVWLDGLGAELAEADARMGFHLETACRYAREVGDDTASALAARAGARLAAAARSARGRGDLLAEVGFLERAVALSGTDDAHGVALLPALVSALSDAGSSERAEALAERAVSVSARLGLDGVGARSLVERERIRLYLHPERFDVAAARVVVDGADATLRGLGDELGLARSAYLMSDLTWLDGDPVASCAHAERMLGHARRAESGFDIATAVVFMAWALIDGPWPADRAILRCDALVADGRAAGERAAELALRPFRAALAVMTGRVDEAHSSLAAPAELADMRLGAFASYIALLDGMSAMLAGDPAGAERVLRDAEAVVAESDDRWYHSLILVDLAHAILAQHRTQDAVEAVARIDAMPVPCNAEWVTKRHLARALLAAQTGELERGLEDARGAVAVAERTGMVLCCADAHRTLAELLLAAGRADEAVASARRALVLDEAKGNVAAAARFRARFPAL